MSYLNFYARLGRIASVVAFGFAFGPVYGQHAGIQHATLHVSNYAQMVFDNGGNVTINVTDGGLAGTYSAMLGFTVSANGPWHVSGAGFTDSNYGWNDYPTNTQPFQWTVNNLPNNGGAGVQTGSLTFILSQVHNLAPVQTVTRTYVVTLSAP